MIDFINFIGYKLIILISITTKKKFPARLSSNNVIRTKLSHARMATMGPAEDNVSEFIKFFFPDVWKNIITLRKFIITEHSDESSVCTEFCLPQDLLSEQVIYNIQNLLIYYFNNIYLLEGDLFDNIESNNDDSDKSIIDRIDLFSEERLRKIGNTHTRYSHIVDVGESSFTGQYFRDRPAHTTGAENRIITGEIVYFHSYRGKSHISISSKTDNGNIEISDRLEYVPEDFDDLIRLAIKEKNIVRVVAKEKIDDKRRLYWGIEEISLLPH